MTDRASEPAAWPPVLRDIARASGHELRNALNALVVNLEVVRSRTQSLDDSVRLFVTQSVEQAEESVHVAEATIALLNLVVGAIGEDGRIKARSDGGAVSVDATEGEIARLQKALSGLVSRKVVSVSATDATVILEIPDKESAKRE